jgi:hypothetical protein
MKEKRRKPKKLKAAAEPEPWFLCIATDGEVLVARRTPDFERYLPCTAAPPLTKSEAEEIARRICEPSPDAPELLNAYRFISDPRTELDLLHQFTDAVIRAARVLRHYHEFVQSPCGHPSNGWSRVRCPWGDDCQGCCVTCAPLCAKKKLGLQ